jgi:hypothetical protein
LLPSFRLGSVTRFDHTVLRVSRAQKPAGGWPAPVASWGLSPNRIALDQGLGRGSECRASYRRKLSHEKLRRWLRQFNHLNNSCRTACSKRHRTGLLSVPRKSLKWPYLTRHRLPEVGQSALVALLTQPLVDGDLGAAHPFLVVLRFKRTSPRWLRPQSWVKPRKSSVGGRCLALSARATRHAYRMPPAAFSGH